MPPVPGKGPLKSGGTARSLQKAAVDTTGRDSIPQTISLNVDPARYSPIRWRNGQAPGVSERVGNGFCGTRMSDRRQARRRVGRRRRPTEARALHWQRSAPLGRQSTPISIPTRQKQWRTTANSARAEYGFIEPILKQVETPTNTGYATENHGVPGSSPGPATPKIGGYRKVCNRTHSPRVTPPSHNPAPSRILAHRGKLAQASLARRPGFLRIISAQSKKWATIRSSLARITSPRRKVPKPGPGNGPKTRLAITITAPTMMKRTFLKLNRPWLERSWRLLRWRLLRWRLRRRWRR